MLRFAIIAAPRTGSNLLCTLLNSHPDILCHHEVFNPDGIFTALTHRDDAHELGTLADRDRAPLVFLDRIWQTGQGFRCVGFKWTRGQNETAIRRILEDPDIKKIVLRRRNRIKTYISERIAQETRQWEVYSEGELVCPRPRVTVDRADLLNHISQNNQFYDIIHSSLAHSRQPSIDVTYESLFRASEQSRLLGFLGVEDVDGRLTEGSVKQNSTDLRDTIANFCELATSLEGSELQAELHDRET